MRRLMFSRKPSLTVVVAALLCALMVFVPLEVRLQAAITVSEKMVLSTTDNLTNYDTTTGTWTTHAGATTFSLASGTLGVCFMSHTDADLSVNERPLTFTQSGQTWTIDSATQPQYNTTGTPTGEIEVYTSPGAGAAAAGIALTFSDAQTGVIFACYELSGSKTTGFLLQNKVGATDTTTNHTVTLTSGRTASSILMHAAAIGAQVTMTAEYAGIGTTGNHATPADALKVQWDIGGADTTPLITTAANQNGGSYAVEIAIAASATAGRMLLMGVGDHE